MTRNELKERYFQWMCQLVYDKKSLRNFPYQRLLQYLNNREFIYILEMDGNRAEDGVDLRYRFGYEESYDSPMITTYLDDRPCSILEMMVALANRCEENIMDDPDFGNRKGKWFWGMIETLGLIDMTDDCFDKNYVDSVIGIFLDREYSPDGKGGLFAIENCKYDMRTVEIWYQMCWYLDTIL